MFSVRKEQLCQLLVYSLAIYIAKQKLVKVKSVSCPTKLLLSYVWLSYIVKLQPKPKAKMLGVDISL